MSKNKNSLGQPLRSIQVDVNKIPKNFRVHYNIQLLIDKWVEAGCPHDFRIIAFSGERRDKE